MRWRGPALTVFLVVLQASTVANARRSFVVQLMINEEPRGEVFVVPDGDDFLVREADLSAAGIDTRRLPGRTLRLEGESAHDPGHVSLASLAPLVRHRFDEGEVALHLQVEPDLLAHQVIDLQRRARPADLVVGQTPALYVNYGLRGDELIDPRHRSFGFAGELGASAENVFAHTTVTGEDDGTFVRGLTRVSWDITELLSRLTLGDEFVATSGLGGGAFSGGIHFSRRFEMDPWLQRTPLPTLSGAAESPSTLEVYRDGVLVRRESIAPGTFELRNLPVTAGAGEVQYVLRDAFGRETTASGLYAVDGRLLQQGLSDHSYSLGFRREGYGRESFHYEEPVFFGIHRLGLTDALTLGARLEGGETFVSGGPTLTWRLPLGIVFAEGAASHAHDESGGAGLLGWTLADRGLGISFWGQAMSAHYVHASLGLQDERALIDGGASLAVPLGEYGSATLRTSVRDLRDAGTENRNEAHLHWRLGGQTTLTTSATHVTGAEGGRWELFAALNILLSPTSSAQTWAGGSRNAPYGGISIQEHAQNDVGWDYRAAVHQTSEPHADLRVGHRGQRGIARADVRSRPGQSSAGAEFAGSLVAMDGSVHLSRPIERSFALVRVPEAPGARVRYNHREVGRTDERGEFLVPNLQSYNANRLSVDHEDIPFDRAIESLDARAAPPHGGGTIVTFASERIRLVRGRALPPDGAGRSTLRHAKLVVEGEEHLLGSQSQFELDLGSGVHRGEVHHARGVCRLELVVPATDAPILDLGEIPCKEEIRL